MAGNTRYVGAITRYSEAGTFTSARDPIADAMLHLEFLAAEDYVVELMDKRHGIALDDARTRAHGVRAHVSLALQYFQQAQSGPREVCFVPCYYAILNLMKVYILFSELHSELAMNRRHGASYNPGEAASTSFPDDQIVIWEKGTLPLFYQVLTGSQVSGSVSLSVADLYPFIHDVSAEWEIACPDSSRIVYVGHDIENEGNVRYAKHSVDGVTADGSTPLETLPAFGKCVRHLHQPGCVLRGPAEVETQKDWALIASGVDRRFLYHPSGGVTTTAVMNVPVLMPEELPIALALFHLSSVARYHPELLDQFRASRFWPAIAALRDHAVYKIVLLALSFVRKAHVTIDRP